MNRVWLIARREWMEVRRQPSVLGSMAALFAIVGGLILFIAVLFQIISGSPEKLALFEHNLAIAGIKGGIGTDTLASTLVAAFNWLATTQVLGFAAMLAGHAMLHDRQVGTLAFLLLAPVRRGELLAGKVLGAAVPPTLIHLVINGTVGLALSAMPITAALTDRLPPAGGWVAGFLLAGPAWTLFVCSICAVLSSFARDVRAAQQGVWVVVFAATFACAVLINGLLTEGAVVQIMVAALGLGGAIVTLFAGALLIRRDLSG